MEVEVFEDLVHNELRPLRPLLVLALQQTLDLLLNLVEAVVLLQLLLLDLLPQVALEIRTLENPPDHLLRRDLVLELHDEPEPVEPVLEGGILLDEVLHRLLLLLDVLLMLMIVHEGVHCQRLVDLEAGDGALAAQLDPLLPVEEVVVYENQK